MFNKFKGFYREAKGLYRVLKEDSDYDTVRRYLKEDIPRFGNLIICGGQENIIGEGPNIIIANYTNPYRDTIGLVRAYERPLSFVMAKFLFDKDATKEKTKEKLESFGQKNYDMLEKVVNRKNPQRLETTIDNIATFVSRRLTTFGMIPLDLDYNGDKERQTASQKEIIQNITQYLKTDDNSEKNEAVVFFQLPKYRKNPDGTKSKEKVSSKYHAYLPSFNTTVADIAYELYQESVLSDTDKHPFEQGVPIPITPVAFYSDRWWKPFSKTIMFIGKPAYISAFIDPKNPKDPKIIKQEFMDYIEMEMADNLVRCGIPRNKKR